MVGVGWYVIAVDWVSFDLDNCLGSTIFGLKVICKLERLSTYQPHNFTGNRVTEVVSLILHT